MVSPLQVYSGYTNEDIALIQSFVVQDAVLEDDFFIDGFSQKILLKSIPFCNTFNLERLTLPVPDDGYHAEALEYMAVCDSIHRSTESYRIVEVGAGWGPWINLGGVLARNRGIKPIHLVGVEAHPERFSLLKKQLSANKLRPDTDQSITELNGISCQLIQGAAASVHKTLWFPKVDVTDMGAAASNTTTIRDYRGSELAHFPVQGFTLKDLIGSLTVDLLHIDIQGTEFEFVESAIDIINSQVKSMMIGTHSRVIEGKLIETLYHQGWYLHREKPCMVEWKKEPPSLEAMTQVDGCQYWRHAR